MIKSIYFWSVFCLALLVSCNSNTEPEQQDENVVTEEMITEELAVEPKRTYHVVPYDVPIRIYFEYMDSLMAKFDTTLNYSLDEYLLAQANPWLIDTLANTDYYILMERGVFEKNPQSLLALSKGDSLLIPDSIYTERLREKMSRLHIDINIPEYKLRILEEDSILYTFSVRVGQNRKRYLAMAGREVDMRTHTGTGTIYRVNKSPSFINPKDNHVYKSTLRDDGQRTLLPRVPWIEPELNGQRYGQLIHPTTNPSTLDKAYSNGCIGMKEADMWRVYYHAPVGTKIVFRYELEVVDELGDTILLKHIYRNNPKYRPPVASIMTPDLPENVMSVCDCGQISQIK